MRNLRVWLFAILLLLIGAGLRTWNLPMESPAYEEVMAILAATRTPAEYLRFPQIDRCPPLLYAMLHPVAVTNINALRVVPLIAGALAPVLLYLLGRLVLGRALAIIAGLLLAISPLHVFHSQLAQPAAVATLPLICAFYFLIRSCQTDKLIHWIAYDLCAVALLYLHPDAVFLVGAMLLLHLGKAFFDPPREHQRRARRWRVALSVIINYVLIVVVSLPWLVLMRVKVPWHETRPMPMELVELFWHRLNFGMLDSVPVAVAIAMGVILLLLLPPLIKAFRELGFARFALVALTVLIATVPFIYSLFWRVRFSAEKTGVLVAPLFAGVLALGLARTKIYMRIVLLGAICSVYGWVLVQQASREQLVSWRSIVRTVNNSAKPAPGAVNKASGDLLVFWPDFTLPMSEYYFGDTYPAVSASDLLKNLVTPPANDRFFFIISQYPDSSGLLHTFPGALNHHSTSKVLWRDKLNMVVSATDVNMTDLKLWYDQPQSLNVQDLPTSDTQFIFPASHKIFKTEQFHHEEADLSYELDGRRAVWTKSEFTDLQLMVMLAPGSYALKLHCSPTFERPEQGISRKRDVSVQLRTGEQRKKVTSLADESTIKLVFSTDAEIRRLPVHIEVKPALKIGRETFGLKIYSIAIDQIAESEAN